MGTEPFEIKITNPENIIESFKKAILAFSRGQSSLIIRKHLYDILLQLKKEHEKKYTPSQFSREFSKRVGTPPNKYSEN